VVERLWRRLLDFSFEEACIFFILHSIKRRQIAIDWVGLEILNEAFLTNSKGLHFRRPFLHKSIFT
jgi:hypothetical protein